MSSELVIVRVALGELCPRKTLAQSRGVHLQRSFHRQRQTGSRASFLFAKQKRANRFVFGGLAGADSALLAQKKRFASGSAPISKNVQRLGGEHC